MKTAAGAARLVTERLLDLDEGCAGTLPPVRDLIAALDKVEFLDVRTAAGNKTQHGISRNGSPAKLKDTSVGARAFVISDLERAIYPKTIFLRANFFSEPSRRVQQSVVLHELLHIYFNVGDMELCHKFDMACGNSDSYKLTNWLEGNCFPPEPGARQPKAPFVTDSQAVTRSMRGASFAIGKLRSQVVHVDLRDTPVDYFRANLYVRTDGRLTVEYAKRLFSLLAARMGSERFTVVVRNDLLFKENLGFPALNKAISDKPGASFEAYAKARTVMCSNDGSVTRCTVWAPNQR